MDARHTNRKLPTAPTMVGLRACTTFAQCLQQSCLKPTDALKETFPIAIINLALFSLNETMPTRMVSHGHSCSDKAIYSSGISSARYFSSISSSAYEPGSRKAIMKFGAGPI